MGFNFGDFLKYELGKKKVKAIDLAKAIGKSPAYITKIQKENIIPDYETLRIFSEKLEIDYEFLLFQIGIIDENTLLHINAFNNLKGYLAEIVNLNEMTSEKIETFTNLMKEYKHKLEMQLDSTLINEVKNYLGKNFIFPKFENPYKQDSYYGFKQIKNLKITTGEKEKFSSKFIKIPVFTDFNNKDNKGPIKYLSTDISNLKDKIDFDEDVVWYTPLEDSKHFYLVKLNAYSNKDKIIFKYNGTIYEGIFNIKTYDNNTIGISNIKNTKNLEQDDSLILFPENNPPKNFEIIGKILSEFNIL